MDSKMCQNCKRDFKDSENFNWSCRTHQSQWSGEMWWCCGKSSKDALGCKFQKHFIPKEDDEDQEIVVQDKLLKCQCCKELGHVMQDCPKDPNLKTKQNLDNEQTRILKAHCTKKVFADSCVQTAHLLKKCVQVQDNDSHKNTSFKRGVMQFEDYNYASFNSHILVETDLRKEVKRKLNARDLKELQSYSSMVQKPSADHQSLLSNVITEDLIESEESSDDNSIKVFFNETEIDRISKKQNEDPFE